MNIGTGQIAAIFGLIGVVMGGIIWTWKKLINPAIKFVNNQGKQEEDIKYLKELGDKFKKHIEYVSKKTDAHIYLSDHAMFICDWQGLCILANDAMCEMFGGSEREMMGQGWLQFIHERDRDRVIRIWDQVKENNNADFKMELRVIHGNTNEEVKCICHTIISRDRDRQIMVSVGRVKK